MPYQRHSWARELSAFKAAIKDKLFDLSIVCGTNPSKHLPVPFLKVS